MRVGRGWERGRQASGYDKLLLVEARRFDAYLLRFPTRSCVPRHRDPVAGAGHLRLNLILVPAQRGGEFECDGAIVDRPRIKLFRSDRCAHAVTRVEAGTRWVLLAGRALLWPERRTLLVADLHLGKGAVFRARGVPVPSGSTAAAW